MLGAASQQAPQHLQFALLSSSGMPTRAIADAYHIHPARVKRVLKKVYNRLDIHPEMRRDAGRTQLAIRLAQSGYLDYQYMLANLIIAEEYDRAIELVRRVEIT